jgi:hypothetical protein
MDNALLEFVKHARKKGMDHATIRILLLSAGWREMDIAHALAEEGLDIPVPEPARVGGAKEAFQYLLALTALCFVVVNVLVIAFEYIDQLLPDLSENSFYNGDDFRQSTIRWSMAMLLVGFPLYLGFSRWIGIGLRNNPERSKSPIRRWLIYLALFAAAITITGDIVALVFGFLTGEMTSRLVLRVLVVFAISTLVFCYYMLSLRTDEKNYAAYMTRLDRSFGAIAFLVTLFTLSAGFGMVESPFTARLRRFDAKRVDDLRSIVDAIERQVVQTEANKPKLKRPLPQSLDEVMQFVVEEERGLLLNLTDPQTGSTYEYAVKGDTKFELCATFSLDKKSSPRWGQGSYPWGHSAGRSCFEFDVLNPK